LKILKKKCPLLQFWEEDGSRHGFEMIKLGACEYLEKKDSSRLRSIIFKRCRSLNGKEKRIRFEKRLKEENERLLQLWKA